MSEALSRPVVLDATVLSNYASIVFFDEFDALAGQRESRFHSTTQSIVNMLLAELDGVEGNDDLLVVGATNRPEAIDPAIRRQGRVGEMIEVLPPDTAGMREIFRVHTSGVPTADDVDPAWFADRTPDGITGADIAAVVERALHHALRDADDTSSEEPAVDVRATDFEVAIDDVIGCDDSVIRGFD